MLCLICNELLYDTINYELIPCVSHINTISLSKVVTQLSKLNKDLSVCSTELHSLVLSLGYLVSNEKQVRLEGH
jgi:hypothetical protein